MGLWKEKGMWRFSFIQEGKKYTGSGYATKAEARAAREEKRKQVKDQAKAQIQTDMAFSTIANLYLDWSEKRHASKTYQYKRMVFREFLKFHGDINIREITPQQLHEYLNTRPTKHNYNVHRKELSALFSWTIHQLQIIDRSPCWNLEKLPEEKPKKKIPTREEFFRLLAAAGAEERPLLVLLIHTMARIDEILRLAWEDVNFDTKVVTLWTKKRRGGSYEPRYIPMNEDLYKTLWFLWQRRKQDHWVFYNEATDDRFNRRPKLMRSLCKKAGIPHYGFHSIRHFIATYLHDIMKASTGVIGNLLGHKSKQTTEIYLHSVDEAARETIKKLEGIIELKEVGR